MCDRTKSEVLARELCIQYYVVSRWDIKSPENRRDNLKSFVESNWNKWLDHSKRVINLLDNHGSKL